MVDIKKGPKNKLQINYLFKNLQYQYIIRRADEDQQKLLPSVISCDAWKTGTKWKLNVNKFPFFNNLQN